MNNKKGFTLVEILATIVLISLLLGLGIPGIMKISQNMKKRNYNTKVDLIEQAGILWGQNNKTELQRDKCDIDKDSNTGESGKESNCRVKKIDDLIKSDYLEADGKDDSNNYIYINPETDKNIIACEVYIYIKDNRVYAYFDKENCNP